MLSADGSTLLTDKEAILKRWAEHFNSVLNRPSSINEDAIDRLSQIECNVLNFHPSWKQEKQFNNCHVAKLQVHMQFLQRFIMPWGGGGGATHGRETDSVVRLHVEEGGFPTRI